MNETVLVVNPGSTGTKVALFSRDELQWEESLPRPEMVRRPGYVRNEVEPRLSQVKELLQRRSVSQLGAVVGRGGLLRPIPGGVYLVNEIMCEDALAAGRGEHASNLGCILAQRIASQYGVNAYIVDPVSTDELSGLARVSGFPELPRQSLAHYLSIKAVYRSACRDLNVKSARIVAAHLGSGITVAALDGGKVVDTTNANDEGPFSPERAGELPVGDLVRLCFSGRYSESELLAQIVSQSGLKGYLGTADAREVEGRMENGDERAKAVYDAMIYQIGKEIGAMATVLMGRVDAVVLTGGLARSTYLTDRLRRQVRFIAPILIYPGETEMEALAQGAFRVLSGQEPAKIYPEGGSSQ